MALLDDLKSLAKLPRSSAPFLTLYLNTRWDSEKQRERVRIFVKTRLRECLCSNEELPSPARRGAQEDVERIEHFVKGLVNREWDEATHGLAVFACSDQGVYRVVRSQLPFEDALVCSDRPMLKPVAAQAHAGEAAVLAMVSGDAGRLLEFELGGLCREWAFSDEEFPGRHDQGGWSQARYQRHVDEHLQRNLKRLAGHLVTWVDERRIRRVLLSGADPLLAAFEAHLPKRVGEAICARIHLDPSAAPDALHAEAVAAVRMAREREDRSAADALLERSPGKGRSALGPEAVSEAVAQGKVHELYLDRGFQAAGWKCFHCGALGVKVPLGCSRCGADVDSVELGEELVRGTLATDGRVVVLDGHEKLWAEGGAGATLRYS